MRVVSLRERVYMNIGCKNGLPHQKTAAALQSMWTQGGEEEKTYECSSSANCIFHQHPY